MVRRTPRPISCRQVAGYGARFYMGGRAARLKIRSYPALAIQRKYHPRIDKNEKVEYNT